MKRTTYFNEEGKVIKRHAGEPKKIESFLKATEQAVRLDIDEFVGQGYFARHFFNVEGRWVGELFKGESGWKRQVLVPKKTLMRIEVETLSDEEANDIIRKESEMVFQSARESVRWCDQKDEEDKDGRYWLNAYSGAGVYRLVVQNGKIVGSIYGGIHGSRCAICSPDAWAIALRKAIEERISGEYQLLKADGSGTYFYLRNEEDAKYLGTKIYEVPSADGGYHLNIEVE